MALDVWLQGRFDIGKLWEYLRDSEYFQGRSELEAGRFTRRLRDVKDVAYQVYSSGKVRICTDDYSDPYMLVQIIVDAAWLTSGSNPDFKVISCKPLLSSYERIGTPLLRMKLGLEGPHGINEALALVEADVCRITRVFEAVRDLQQEARGEG